MTATKTIGTQVDESAKDSDASLSNEGTATPKTQDMNNEQSASDTPPTGAALLLQPLPNSVTSFVTNGNHVWKNCLAIFKGRVSTRTRSDHFNSTVLLIRSDAAKELGRLLEQTNGEIVRRRLWEVFGDAGSSIPCTCLKKGLNLIPICLTISNIFGGDSKGALTGYANKTFGPSKGQTNFVSSPFFVIANSLYVFNLVGSSSPRLHPKTGGSHSSPEFGSRTR
jgi:hypothetical protein